MPVTASARRRLALTYCRCPAKCCVNVRCKLAAERRDQSAGPPPLYCTATMFTLGKQIEELARDIRIAPRRLPWRSSAAGPGLRQRDQLPDRAHRQRRMHRHERRREGRSRSGSKSFSGSSGSLAKRCCVDDEGQRVDEQRVAVRRRLARRSPCRCMPEAPARLSTTTCWPRPSESFGASRRPSTSTLPPGAKGTTIRRGRDGNDSDCAKERTACAASTSDTAIRTDCRHAQPPPTPFGHLTDFRAGRWQFDQGLSGCHAPFPAGERRDGQRAACERVAGGDSSGTVGASRSTKPSVPVYRATRSTRAG